MIHLFGLIVWGIVICCLIGRYGNYAVKNEIEFNNACQKEIETIPKLVEFWKEHDREIEDVQREIEKECQDRVSMFYEGKLHHYPGCKGPVGFNFAKEIGRTIEHHKATYFVFN